MNVEKRRAKGRAAYQRHREKRIAAVKAYRAANPDKIKHLNLRRAYGISLEEYNALAEAQGHKCAICGASDAQSTISKKHFFVDHCHETGKVRGLLCNHCNRGLGAFKDNTEFLAKAIAYLRTLN
jgi:hypothetical protein